MIRIQSFTHMFVVHTSYVLYTSQEHFPICIRGCLINTMTSVSCTTSPTIKSITTYEYYGATLSFDIYTVLFCTVHTSTLFLFCFTMTVSFDFYGWGIRSVRGQRRAEGSLGLPRKMKQSEEEEEEEERFQSQLTPWRSLEILIRGVVRWLTNIMLAPQTGGDRMLLLSMSQGIATGRIFFSEHCCVGWENPKRQHWVGSITIK